MTRYYIAGPMSGYPNFNYPSFRTAASQLRSAFRSDEFISPVELDEEENLDPEDTADYSTIYYDVLARDLRNVMAVDALVVLPNWENSVGARAEVSLAVSLAKPIFLFVPNDPARLLEPLSDENTGQSEQSEGLHLYDDTVDIVKDPVTGGRLFDETTDYVEAAGGSRKGQKIARFDLIPAEALAELAVAYGVGAKKYGDSNWLISGYRYSLAYGALLRHLYRWILREDTDPETGVHHLALVAWHAFALMTFQARNLGEDDRA